MGGETLCKGLSLVLFGREGRSPFSYERQTARTIKMKSKLAGGDVVLETLLHASAFVDAGC